MESASILIPGVDYPSNIREFEAFFPDEESCRAYVTKLRWLQGFVCRRCGAHEEPWLKRNGILRCRSCAADNQLLAGTVLQDSKKPLRMWLLAMWHVTCQKQGVSALGLQRALGLGSYQAAWSWLHKLRRAMVRPRRERLKGIVQVDETFVGGVTEGGPGRSTSKALVVIAAEEVGLKIGRIRLGCVNDASEASLVPFVQEVIEPGSTVHTDGWSGYAALKGLDYVHQTTKLAGKGKGAAHSLMPHVHLVASLLKRWLLGTHQGAVNHRYLDYYLDEFTFRFNRRTSRSRGLLFYRLLQQAVQVEPAPYKRLTASTTTSRSQGRH